MDKINKELQILKTRIEDEITELKNKGFNKEEAGALACLNYGGNKYLRDLATAIFNEVYSN